MEALKLGHFGRDHELRIKSLPETISENALDDQ